MQEVFLRVQDLLKIHTPLLLIALQSPICFSISYSNYTIKLVNSSTAKLLMQLLFLLLVLFQDFLHNLLCSRPILHTGQFDQQITHDHSIMGTANDKSYDTTHDNLEDDTHQGIHQDSHHDSTPSAVILRLMLFRFFSQS